MLFSFIPSWQAVPSCEGQWAGKECIFSDFNSVQALHLPASQRAASRVYYIPFWRSGQLLTRKSFLHLVAKNVLHCVISVFTGRLLGCPAVRFCLTLLRQLKRSLNTFQSWEVASLSMLLSNWCLTLWITWMDPSKSAQFLRDISCGKRLSVVVTKERKRSRFVMPNN